MHIVQPLSRLVTDWLEPDMAMQPPATLADSDMGLEASTDALDPLIATGSDRIDTKEAEEGGKKVDG